MTTSAGDALLRKTGGEVTAILVHMKKLLRIRNQLCSPLLRLPTEIIIRILSLIMAELDSLFHRSVGMPIYGTCHRIHKIMSHATELWWRVDFSRIWAAHFIYLRSGGDPRVILLDLRSVIHGRRSEVKRILDHWGDKLGFKGHRLDTLEFCGSQSAFSHFSWILGRPLPRVKSLKIHIGELIDDELVEASQDPVHLELPACMPLQVLDLRNVTLSWSSQSHLFDGLRELHLSFRDCGHIVTIPEDELFGIFDASPRLEHLSLLRVGHQIPLMGDVPLPPRRILQFPNLASLSLENDPMVVKHTLEYMDLPVIDSLKIRSFISAVAAQAAASLFFPDDRLPERLFPNSSTFVVRSIGEEPYPSIGAEIGSVSLHLDFPFDEGELGRNSFMFCIPQLVPPSVTTLKLGYSNLGEQGWRDFFTSHSGVRFIECTEGYESPASESLWNALTPTGGESADVPCPKLESILITVYTDEVSFTSLSDCLRNRQIAGFMLKHLRMLDYHRSMDGMDIDGLHQMFDPLVGAVEAGNSFGTRSKVNRALICEPEYMLTCPQWGRNYIACLGDLEGRNEI